MILKTKILKASLFFISTVFSCGCCLGKEMSHVTLGVTVGHTTDKQIEVQGLLHPTVHWTHGGNVASLDCETGVAIQEGEEAGLLSFLVFGRIHRRVQGWDLNARLDTDSSDWHCIDASVQAVGGPTEISLIARATIDTLSRTGELTQIGLEQPFAPPAVVGGWGSGEALVASRYNFVSRRPDFAIAYGKADTTVTVSVDAEKQSVTVRQRIDANREISPIFTSDGQVELEYVLRNGAGRGGVMTANYKPINAVTLQYNELSWTAHAVIPIDGYCNVQEGAKVNIRRSFESP